MTLKMSAVSRNLHAKVTMLGLELEDMLALAMGCAIAMLVGEFLFPDRYMYFLPMNWFLLLLVLVLGVPGLMLFKYGKRRADTYATWSFTTRCRATTAPLGGTQS